MENLNTQEINGLERLHMKATNRARYWEEETPFIMIANNLHITYFEQSGVLQIGFLVTDAQGQRRLGRKISLRKEVISKTPRALFFLRDVFKNWSREYDENSKSK